MINIAIIEDNRKSAENLNQFINDYIKKNKNGIKVSIDFFDSSEDFLESNDQIYHLAFFDIDLPNLNGMEASYKLRERNNDIIIIFVTNLPQYAIKGYQVNALDYMIKPVEYKDIVVPLERAISLINKNVGQRIVVKRANEIIQINSHEISYIEVLDHKLTYHTLRGDVSGYGSLSKLEKVLSSNYFMRCNNCYLVNPKFIKSVKKNIVVMRDDTELKISKPRKKKFMLELTGWLGKGNFI